MGSSQPQPGMPQSLSLRRLLVVVLLLRLAAAVPPAKSLPGPAISRERCSPDRLVVYRVTMETHWTREDFPKQYPEWRPPAQWSKLVGRSHDASFVMFRVGQSAGSALQTFAETGRSEGLETLSQAHTGVLDDFGAPPIPNGAGLTHARFFADGNHTKVSIVARIVPSPDWFVGLDSVNLCKESRWIDSFSTQVGPLDAGTDSGFTFTAPNWPSEPQQKITHITSQYPDHPANSFFYPHVKHLPPIATFHFQRARTYHLKEDISSATLSSGNTNTIDNPHQDISNDVEPIFTKRKDTHHLKKHHKGMRRPVTCVTSEWGLWSSCSVSCGLGESLRTRRVVRAARRGGQPCPVLEETRLCVGQVNCSKKFFKW